MCRMEGFDSFTNKEADCKIKALHVYCVNEKKGCTTKSHFNSDCKFVDMYYPSRCGMMLKRHRQYIKSQLDKDCPCH